MRLAVATRMGARFAFGLGGGLWLGLAAAPALGAGPALVTAALGLLLACLPRMGLPVLIPAFLLLGLARGGAAGAAHDHRAAAFRTGVGTWRLTARVDEPPRREADAPSATLRVLAASPRLPRGLRVRLRLPAGSAAEWGDTLEVLARLEPPATRRVPGGFDASASARAAGVVATGRGFTASVRPARGVACLAERLAMRVRRAGERSLAGALSPRARELATPLLFGDRSGMGTETDAALRASGLVHLLALSGLHVTWVAGAARGLAALAGGGLLARAMAGALAALLYALVAGPIPSLARAVASEALVTLARASQRALDPLQSLGLAAALLLAWQPAWALDLGFQLSCAATFGLVGIGARLAPVPRALLSANGAFGAPGGFVHTLAPVMRPLAAPIALTLGAQLVVLPWLCGRFHAIPWAALAGNLIAVPLSEGLLAAAALGAAFDAVLSGAGATWFAAGESLAAALHAVVGGLGLWPGALLATGASPWPALSAALASALLAAGLDSPRALDHRMRESSWRAVARVSGVTALGVTALALLASPPLRPPPGHWWVVVLDVGQGDAVAVGTARGWWLVDAGPRSPRWDAGEGALLPFLRWAGVRELERVLVTHDDGDHTGGMAALRRGIPVGEWCGAAPQPGVPGTCARFGLRSLARGDTLAGPPLVRVLWPPRAFDADRGIASRGDNAASLVLEVGEGEARVLLTADADSVVEAALRATPRPALFKAGHHGSGSSSGAIPLAALRPRRVAVSCGARNPYGHPHPGALSRLAATGAVLERTDLEGTLWYELSERGIRRLDWRTGEPFRATTMRPTAAGAAGASRYF